MVTAEAAPEVNLDAPLSNEWGFECIRLRLPPEWRLTEDIFLELCALNEGWEFETTADGELVIMPGTGLDNSERAQEIGADLVQWKRVGGGGRSGGEAGMAHLPNGVLRAPDVSWISPERMEQRPDDYDGVLIPVCPDFVVEIRSRSDSVARQQEKMAQWMAYGARLGWLIDAYSEKVWIYREGQGCPGRAGEAHSTQWRGCVARPGRRHGLHLGLGSLHNSVIPAPERKAIRWLSAAPCIGMTCERVLADNPGPRRCEQG